MTHQTSDAPPWNVLLVGGHSGVGKTVVARRLAQMYHVGLTQVDDVRLVLQRVITPQRNPVLHSFLDPNILEKPTHALRDQLIAVNEFVCSAMEIIVAHHVATRSPCILEGDGILPAFAARSVFADLDVRGTVRAAFIVEHDKDRILHNMKGRGRGFDAPASEQQQQWVELSWQHGQWLAREAARVGLPVVPSQPWETLASRIRAIIDN